MTKLKYTQIKRIAFSPTGGTSHAVDVLCKHLGLPVEEIPCMKPSQRAGDSPILIDRDALLIVGMPVYAGRLPNLLLPYLKRLVGDNTHAICVVTYGNRHYDDALMELKMLLESQNFEVIGAGAIIAEHSFSEKIAPGHPDAADEHMICALANGILNRSDSATLNIPGEWPLRPYYSPKGSGGVSFDFKKIKPVTDDGCTSCGLCAAICPMDAIDFSDYKTIIGKCIKCCACVKKCPVKSKQFVDENFNTHKRELEDQCGLIKTSEVYF